MHAWQWFETKMLGYTPRKLPRTTRLKLVGITVALGILLGFALTLSGIGTGFIAAGMRQAGYDPSLMLSTTPPPSAAVTVSTPTFILTPTLQPKGGGWVNP